VRGPIDFHSGCAMVVTPRRIPFEKKETFGSKRKLLVFGYNQYECQSGA